MTVAQGPSPEIPKGSGEPLDPDAIRHERIIDAVHEIAAERISGISERGDSESVDPKVQELLDGLKADDVDEDDGRPEWMDSKDWAQVEHNIATIADFFPREDKPLPRKPRRTTVRPNGGRKPFVARNDGTDRDAQNASERAAYDPTEHQPKHEFIQQPNEQATLRYLMQGPKFIPKNRREMTEVAKIWKHIRNPLTPGGGVYDYLVELDQQTGRDPDRAAIRSRLFEHADHLDSAQQSVIGLRQVMELLATTELSFGTNLHDIAEAHPELAKGLAYLVQYMDGLDVLVRGGSIAPSTQWTCRENKDPVVLVPGKNKRLEDAYTGRKQTQKERDYIAERLKEIRARSVLTTVRDAVENARREENFWLNVREGSRFTYIHLRDEVVAATAQQSDSFVS